MENMPIELSCVIKKKLIAQTPLIHFQHKPTVDSYRQGEVALLQSGATLRASEVKPKLDRFLIKKHGESVPEDWKVSKLYNALDYKMHFTVCSGNKAKNVRKRDNTFSPATIAEYPFYFGNTAKSDNIRKEIVFNDVEMTVICRHTKLRSFIEENLEEFFILHNFGTRQSKGFGGFIVEGTGIEKINSVIANTGNAIFHFDVKYGDDRALMYHAQSVYAVMKGGLNSTGFYPYDSYKNFKPCNGTYRNEKAYIKGFIQREFLDKNTGSDKAFMKSKLVPPIVFENCRKDKQKTDYEKYEFVRAILGLADHYEFRDDIRCEKIGETEKNNRKIPKYLEKKIYILDLRNAETAKDANGVLNAGDVIQRFKSPVQIKVFSDQKRVVFLFDDSYKEILDKSFVFLDDADYITYTNHIKDGNYDSAASLLRSKPVIKTPEKFDKQDFATRFMEYFEKHKSTLGECFADYKNSKDLKLCKGGGKS